jgi:anaerobic selenocysteine-containing dehydrogenase
VKTDLRFTTDFFRQLEEHPESSGNLKLIFTDLTFGTEVLSAQSECLAELEPEPVVIMHTSEAKSLDLIDGDLVYIQTESGNLEAKLKVVENMGAGVLIIPRHRKLPWQIFKTGMPSIGRQQIKKVGEVGDAHPTLS